MEVNWFEFKRDLFFEVYNHLSKSFKCKKGANHTYLTIERKEYPLIFISFWVAKADAAKDMRNPKIGTMM